MAEVKGGTKLANALAEMAANLEKVGTLKVGWLSGAKYPNGTPFALVAAIQNYGAPAAGIPPRPFFTNMVKAKSPEWPAAIAGLLKANNYDTAKVLDLVGMEIKFQLQQSIKEMNDPPLKPATLKARGVAVDTVYNPLDQKTFGAKPLIRTGQLFNSVAYSVK